MTFPLFDSHCHLDLEPLSSSLPDILQEARSAGVQGFIIPGVHPDGWGGISALAAELAPVLPAFGVHPMHAACVTDEVLEQLLERATEAVAIGEIGFDPACQVPMELQERVLRQQLRLAITSDLPVLIHCRQAFQRLFAILRDEHADKVGGIMHSYSGSVEMAREFIKLGYAISISGTVTWDNAVKPLRVARELPLEHLVLESDAPDITPRRYRGEFNRPAWITETAQRVAELRESTLEEVARITTANVCRYLRLGHGFA